TAGFFLLLTGKIILPAFACGVIAIVSIILWLWETDPTPNSATVNAADHRPPLPVGAVGMRTHSWWAVVILLIVDATICASFAFAHVHVSLMSDVCPPAGARLPDLAFDTVSVVFWLASALLLEIVRRWDLRGTSVPAKIRFGIVVAGALTIASIGFASNAWGHLDAGLAPKANAWSATVMTLVSFQGLHVVVITLMAVYLIARFASGRLRPNARATLDNTVLFWQYAAVQGAVVVVAIQALPRILG
ncbi:MAG TPA: cytochrome ubiquinol oxidase subunit I, partial [Burkholderiaceae bacterium]|nr:cytochrome ubiquinol oxidase subunit I [Burkholderiaceae bacterium]